jgi:ATP-binding cassette subfamily B protein
MVSQALPRQQEKAAPKANIKWTFGYVLAHKRALYGSLLCGVFGGLMVTMEPFIIGLIVDHVQTGQMALLGQDIFLLIFFGVLTVIGFYGQRYFSGDLSYSVNYDIRQTLFDHLLELDQSFYNRYSAGDLISRMHSDVDMIWRLIVLAALRFSSATTALIFTFILLASVNLTLTLVAFAVLTVSTSFQILAGLSLAPKFEKVQAQGGVLSALIQDATSGIQTIKTFGRETGAAAKFAEENGVYRQQWLYFKRRNEPVGMLPNMISQLTMGVVVMYGGVMTATGTLSIGNFTQFLIYLGMISSLLLQLGTIYQRYQQSRGALTRLTPILQAPKIMNRTTALPFSRSQADISFEHVSLKLDGTAVLDDVSLTFPAGKVVAFVGATGCGKTLLVSLLARVYDPTHGQVKIGDVDVRDYDLGALREALAFVPQTTFLFSQTLEANLRMGKTETDYDSVASAVQISRLGNDLPQLPYGMETMVGEKGVMLSGGQKQRVAIARAIIRDPAILVLDDALSSVDTHTAADILADLRSVLRSRTSLIIAHRIATVKDADIIVFMDKGRIVDQGTHEQLIARGGQYARMVERELRGDDETFKSVTR